MPKKCKKVKLLLTEDQKDKLTKIAHSRTAPQREIERAKILLMYNEGQAITNISKTLGISRETIYKHINRALAIGVVEALKKFHRPKESAISFDAIAYVIDLACQKPKEIGYAEEVWTLSLLAKHIKERVDETGFDCFKKASKVTVHRILSNEPIKPFKMKYYLEKRDPDFQRKMEEILVIYREVNLINDGLAKDNGIITLSIDEKPGVQALKNIAPDLPPCRGKHKTFSRDYEYKRLGTMSILAAMDLHTGHIFCQVHERHRSKEFVSLLKEIEGFYPPDKTLRLLLDNHSAHISKETMSYLSSCPNRFIYAHTPKHGSWLNIVESLFSKMARTFLKYIRVDNKKELRERTLKWVNEINKSPVVYRWKKFDLSGNLSKF